MNWLVVTTDPEFDIEHYQFGNGQTNLVADTSPGILHEETHKMLPRELILHQNYPNPFNPATTISFELPTKCEISFVIYNTIGQVVKNLVHETLNAGRYEYQWNATNDEGHFVNNGVYIGVLNAGNLRQVVKMTLLK